MTNQVQHICFFTNHELQMADVDNPFSQAMNRWLRSRYLIINSDGYYLVNDLSDTSQLLRISQTMTSVFPQTFIVDKDKDLQVSIVCPPDESIIPPFCTSPSGCHSILDAMRSYHDAFGKP
jgi:hypothetical protein